jgi:hypothetical protein
VVEFVTKCLDRESFVALVDNREELGDFYMEDQEVPFLLLMDSNCSNGSGDQQVYSKVQLEITF